MLPKFEAMIAVPTGGWAVSVVTAGDGPTTSTVPAGTYYLSSAGSGARSLLAEFEYQLDTDWTGIGGFTISLSATTGKVTIVGSVGGIFELTWTSTALRDALGFADTITGTEVTGTNQATHLWLPNVPAFGRRGTINARGARESDQSVTRAASGKVGHHVYNRYTVDRWTFRGLTKAKTWQEDEATTNESAERFWLNHLTTGQAFRYYIDATSATSYLTPSSLAREYRYAGGDFSDSVRRLREGYDGSWEWTFDGMLEV